MIKCPECGNQIKWDQERGEIICRSCGLVVDDKLVDFGQEWRDFDEDGDKFRRTGAPLRHSDANQLVTTIGQKHDLYSLSGKNRSKFNRLRTWQNRVANSLERNLRIALSELKRISSALKLTNSVEEEAARIYALACQRNLVRGRPMEAVVAACLYASCRRFDVPRTLDEFSQVSDLTKKDVGRTYRYIVRNLDIKILPSNAVDYLPKLCAQLNLGPDIQTLAAELVQKSQRLEFTSGRTPNGVAAASLYVAAVIKGERRTQRQVADAAGITEVTIRNRYQEMEDELHLKKLMRDTKHKLKLKSRAEKSEKLKKFKKDSADYWGRRSRT